MKKLILFLLPLFVLAQNPTNFPYGIKNTVAPTNSTPTYFVTQETDGIHKKTPAALIAKTEELLKKQFLSTGLIKNGLISINADPAKYNITAGIGVISNFDDPENPVSTIVNFPAVTAKTPTYLTTGNITYIAINASGAVVEQATEFTSTQRRDLILLGAVIHSNLTNINVVNNISAPTNADTNQLHDFMEAIGALNLTGNKYTANGANLSLDKSAGSIFKFGVNFATDWKKPHELSQSAGTALTFRYRTQTGAEGSDVTILNPSLYDLSGTLTTVPVNKFTIQTVTIFQTGLTRIQYGQNYYNSLEEAQAAIFTRNYVPESNIAQNGITRAYIIIRNTTTSLSNATDAKIIEAQKFGGVASGGVALTLANIVSALGYTPENVANKAINFTTVNNTLYPTVQATKDFVSVYSGQTWGVLGDSFAQIDLFQPALLLKLGITSISDGIGGSCITGGTNFAEGDAIDRTPFVDRIVAMLANSITGIIIEGGSNDFHYNIPLGSYGSTNVNNFYGALDFICAAIANRPTKIKAFFITPTFRGDTQHGGSSTGLANWENMKPYITAIKTVCSRYSIQVVDEFGAGINYYNTDVYTTDGVHPNNAAGTELYTTFLTSNINSNAGTLNVTPLDITASYELDPTFKRTIYWDKNGSDLQNDAAIVLTNTVDTDLRFKVSSPASGLYASIGTGKTDVNLSLQELYGKVLIGTNTSVSDDKFQVSGTGYINSGASATGLRVAGNAGGGWSGRIVAGGSSSVFLMGEYAGNAWLGAHNSTLSAWNDLYINPDGGSNLYLGKYSGSPILTIDNSTGISTFTGTPTAPTATAGTNTTQIATTAFVQAATANNVALTGNQTITGQKNFNDSALNSTAIQSVKTQTNGTLIDITTGVSTAAGTLVGITSGTGTSSKLLNLNAHSASTGMPLTIQNSGTNKFTVDKTGVMMLGTFTVATLPTPTTTAYATVTDATTPTYLGTLTGGGTVVCPVFYNGTAWVSH